MATPQSDLHKFETTFVGDITVHTIRTPGVVRNQRWRHKEFIGKGGFGDVWLEEGEEGEDGVQLRAVKRILQAGKDAKWSQELSILAQLRNHQDLFVQFLGWYEDESKRYVFFAMEYIKHGDLGKYLNDFGLQATLQAKEIVTQVLKGLVILHQRNICHRDIKPKVKIADFGISKNQNNTLPNTHCGTPPYIAPEVQGFPKRGKNAPYSNLVDMWSLGMVTHEILTLDLPFILPDVTDSDLPQQSEWGKLTPVVDADLFYKFCHGEQSLPTESLRTSGVDDQGIAFVKALLAVDPKSRICATEALQHPWLSGVSRVQEITNPRPQISTRGSLGGPRLPDVSERNEPHSSEGRGHALPESLRSGVEVEVVERISETSRLLDERQIAQPMQLWQAIPVDQTEEVKTIRSEIKLAKIKALGILVIVLGVAVLGEAALQKLLFLVTMALITIIVIPFRNYQEVGDLEGAVRLVKMVSAVLVVLIILVIRVELVVGLGVIFTWEFQVLRWFGELAEKRLTEVEALITIGILGAIMFTTVFTVLCMVIYGIMVVVGAIQEWFGRDFWGTLERLEQENEPGFRTIIGAAILSGNRRL